MSIGSNIQEIRVEKGYSQELVAEELNVSRQSVSKWENDISKPSTDNLRKLSKFFDVPINELVNSDCWDTSNEQKKIFYPSEKVYEKRFKYIRNVSWLIGSIILLFSIAFLKDMEISFGLGLLVLSIVCFIQGYKAHIRWREN